MNMKEIIAKRAALALKENSIVNLGIGIPTLVAKYIQSESIYLHTENGLLGVSELENESDYDPLRVNAGKIEVDEIEGAAYFDSSDSFGMIRGNHVDVAILGALQVGEDGLIANWAIPGKNIMGVGGAMDLLNGAKKVIVTTQHVNKDGSPKLLKTCDFPITSLRPVDMVITDLAVFERMEDKWYLTELMPGKSLSEVEDKTEAHFEVSKNLKEANL